MNHSALRPAALSRHLIALLLAALLVVAGMVIPTAAVADEVADEQPVLEQVEAAASESQPNSAPAAESTGDADAAESATEPGDAPAPGSEQPATGGVGASNAEDTDAGEELPADEHGIDLRALAAQQLGFGPVAAAASPAGGTAVWGLATELTSTSMGRANPLADAYVSPASYDAASRLATWAGGSGSIAADHSATLSYRGTSVNFAKTGGGWLRLSNLQATLDASGNGTVSAIVEYGTAPGAYPNIVYSADLVGVRGAPRVNLLSLTGNAVAPVQQGSDVVWADLAAAWHEDFIAHVNGNGDAGLAWSYASWVSNDADKASRNAQPISFTLEDATLPVVQAPSAGGAAVWGISTDLASAAMGRANPLASAFVAPASFDETARLVTWAGGSGSIAADHSATLSYRGTSVNFAKTGGGWLRLSNLQATLDASGNGTVSAIVEYGTAPGAYPNIVYSADLVGVRGAPRVNLLSLTGNAVAPVQQGSDVVWADLAAAWHEDFIAHVNGNGDAGLAWSYASWVTNDVTKPTRNAAPLRLTLEDTTLPAIPAAPTATTLTVSPTGEIVRGKQVTLTATVTPVAAGTIEFRDGTTVLGTASVSASGQASLTVNSLAVGGHSLRAVFVPSDATEFVSSQSAAASVTIVASVAAKPGSLQWGIRASFVNYIVNGGSVSTSGGAGGYSVFTFPQSTQNFNHTSGTGSVTYRGTVHYQHRAHGIDIKISNPRVVITSATTGSIVVDMVAQGDVSTGVTFATLNLAAASRSSDGSTTTFRNVPSTLTAAGASAFNGFYDAGEPLDLASFVIGAAAADQAGSSSGDADSADWTPPATPPSTTGLSLEGDAAGIVAPGQQITVTGAGFQPNERHIKVVLYSTPTVLATDAKADAKGVVTWTGVLPEGVTGEHTLTLQGALHSVGLPLTITERPVAANFRGAEVGTCTIQDASLQWGFKESWRSYVSTMAKGEWTVDEGAGYETPEFRFTHGTGSYDEATRTGEIAFPGTVRFTGHEGVLNTLISNFRLRFPGDGTAALLVDISGDNRDGGSATATDIVYVTLDLAAGEGGVTDGVFTLSNVPTLLTEDGVQVLSSYPAGTDFDPISFQITLGSDCGDAVAAPEAASADQAWIWWIVGGLLAVILVLVVLLLRRRPAVQVD